jgi:hypothetical protein
MNLNKQTILKRIFPVVIGGILGYTYYYFIGCTNGCAIQSNPYLSTIYGIAIGVVFALPTKKKSS